jgi:hypothetical protein
MNGGEQSPSSQSRQETYGKALRCFPGIIQPRLGFCILDSTRDTGDILLAIT